MRKILLLSGLAFLFFLAIAAFSLSSFNPLPQIANEVFSSKEKIAFPAIDTNNLSPTQQKIITIVKKEYVDQPDGTKYSQGETQPWCANFISWVYNEAGVPLSNPNNGGWRIPGTKTLRAYLQAVERFKPADSGYTPKAGDIMLYDNPSPYGQHVNMVIKNDHGIVTTIGGNEPGGIRITVHSKNEARGFLGYGVL